MSEDIFDLSFSEELSIFESDELIENKSFSSELKNSKIKNFTNKISSQSTPVKRNKTSEEDCNATQILEELNRSKATNFIDESIFDSIEKLKLTEDNYLHLSELIESAYFEIKDPLSESVPPSDPISRFHYILDIFNNKLRNENLVKKCAENEETIKNMQFEHNDLMQYIQMISFAFTSFIPWTIETGNKMREYVSHLNLSGDDDNAFIDTSDKEAIKLVTNEYLNALESVFQDNLSSIETKDIALNYYKNKINECSQILYNQVMELKNCNTNTSNCFQNPILGDNQYLKSLENENKDLKDKLQIAQNIITSGILPDTVIQALNETKDYSIREIAEIDERYLMDKENIQNQYEAKILQYEEMLEKKEKELNKKENLILTSKKDLKSTERKIEQLKCCNDEMLKDYDRNVEKYVIENSKLKQDLKRKNKCCKHCVMRTSLQMSNKCVGNSGKNILQFNSFNNDGDHERKLNTTFDNGEDIKDNSQEIMDLQNYINSLHQIINNQQIIIDSCNANIRLQNDVIQKQCAMWNDNSSKYYTPNSTLSQVSYVDSFVSLRKNAIECERKDILLKNIENNFVESKGKIQNPELSRVVIDNDEQLNKTGCIFQEIISDNYNKSASNLVEFKPLNNSQFMNFETSTPKRSRIPTLNRSLKYV